MEGKVCVVYKTIPKANASNRQRRRRCSLISRELSESHSVQQSTKSLIEVFRRRRSTELFQGSSERSLLELHCSN